jgi:hypothetical protein
MHPTVDGRALGAKPPKDGMSHHLRDDQPTAVQRRSSDRRARNHKRCPGDDHRVRVGRAAPWYYAGGWLLVIGFAVALIRRDTTSAASVTLFGVFVGLRSSIDG